VKSKQRKRKSILTNVFQRLSLQFKQPTSISDSKQHAGYLSSCLDAASNPQSFERFRSDPNYVAVLEHVTEQEGQQYLRIAQEEYGFPSHQLSLLQDLSNVGQPATYRYLDGWDVSPTVLRYVKVASEINHLFGDLNKKHLGEIGAGFGGQAVVLERLFSAKAYTFYDLPAVLQLIRTFTEAVNSKLVTTMVDGTRPSAARFDLVISNYAFSELTRKLQDLYLENVLLRSKAGYITWNDLGEVFLDSYSLDQLLDFLPGSRVIPEVPETRKGNAIIVWGC
jgi:putative sugar O-methyltransferase